MDDNLISVVMSTYNETEPILRQAIESVQNQTYKNFEFLIILDNPHNEQIQKIVEAYAKEDCRIRILHHEKNQGLTQSLNEGIAKAEGSLIARMDADDIVMPEWIEIELNALKKRDLDFVAASKKNIDEQNQDLGTFINHLSPDKMRKLLPYDNSVNHSTVLMKKEKAEQLGGYRNILSCEDYDLWIRMLCSGCKMAVLPDVLVYYRVRKQSITRMDKYQQYLSEQFIRKMYRKSQKRKRNKFLSMKSYREFCQRNQLSAAQKKRFNYAYVFLYAAFEGLKLGKKKVFLQNMVKAVRIDRRMLKLTIERVMYHVRKQIICR